jgi:hypothetical protein
MKQENRLRFVLSVTCVLLVTEICFAFDDEDFQFWSTAGVAFDIDKDWTATFEEEFRFADDAGQLYYHHSDLGFVYKSLADWIDVGANYRQVFQKDSTGQWRPENRPHLNATLKGRVSGLDLSNRSRLEYRDRENKKDLWRYRNKIALKLPVELTQLKLQPYIADEVFITFNAEDFDQNRLYSGFYIELSKNVRADIFYFRQSSKSGGDWKDANVVGAYLKFYF